MKNHLLAIIIVALAGAIAAVHTIQSEPIFAEGVAPITANVRAAPIPTPTISIPETKSASTITTSATTSAVDSIAFIVDGKKYAAPFEDGVSVLKSMEALASSSDFQFTYKDYPSLGAFVESINGKKNAAGFYWFLYLNGKSSDTGASQTALKHGDVVEWRYEKNY